MIRIASVVLVLLSFLTFEPARANPSPTPASDSQKKVGQGNGGYLPGEHPHVDPKPIARTKELSEKFCSAHGKVYDPKHRVCSDSICKTDEVYDIVSKSCFSKSSACYVMGSGNCAPGVITKLGCASGGTTTSEYYRTPDCKELAKSTVCWVGEAVTDTASAKKCRVGKRVIVDGGVPACEVKDSKPDTVFAYDNHCRVQKGMIPSGAGFGTPSEGYSKGEVDHGSGGFGTAIPPSHIRNGKTMKYVPSEADGGTGGPCPAGHVYDSNKKVCRAIEQRAGNGG